MLFSPLMFILLRLLRQRAITSSLQATPRHATLLRQRHVFRELPLLLRHGAADADAATMAITPPALHFRCHDDATLDLIDDSRQLRRVCRLRQIFLSCCRHCC